MKNSRSIFALVVLALLVLSSQIGLAQSKVELAKVNGKFQLTRNAKPFFIKGAGGDVHLDKLASAGGNAIRTWGTDDLDEVLKNAKANGLMVCVGMWLGHQRHGFDYLNQDKVLQQLDTCLATVRKYKDHPSVLMWGIGNEMEGEGKDPSVWYAVNHIAREIKKIDPNHPTITVIAELGENESKIKSIERFCPDIDIIGINSYGGIESIGTRYVKSGGTKPYVVTEHGPLGPWESGKTPWGSPIEETSTKKGKMFAAGYKAAVLGQPERCLGSFAFMWGHKQETTATWFGMLLPDGTKLAAVDVMSEAWTGSKPKNLCPEITSLKLDKTDGLKPGQKINAVLSASDPEGDKLTIKWNLLSDSGKIGAGGDAQESESTFQSAVTVGGNSNQATITIPKGGGGYRLFAYVYDGQGGAAVANVQMNVPVLIDIPKPAAPSKLPYTVFADGVKNNVFIPSGYMGNAESIKMDENCADNPHAGATCLKATYNSTAAWGGVIWQSPVDDWDGLKDGGANLTGATHLEFWVRGAEGGEVVNFVFGVLDGNQPYRDTAKGELKDVKLTKEWQKLRFPLKNRDLRRIKTGFGWSLAGQAKPVTFYLDDIRYVKE